MENSNLIILPEEKQSKVTPLRAPFPYFGGKRRIADAIWERLGDTPNYVEPFFGSGAVLLARPGGAGRYETVNDLDRYISNFWRAVKSAPEEVASYCDWPINETDLEARHYWLVTEGAARLERIMGDPDAYDAKVAGWWCCGLCSWIGGGWCSGEGPWSWTSECGWVKRANPRAVGIHKKRVQMNEKGVSRQLPLMRDGSSGVHGSGVGRQLPLLSFSSNLNSEYEVGSDEESRTMFIRGWLLNLSDRLRHVRVACGDWTRVLGPSPTTLIGITAILLDPPYAQAGRAAVYNNESDVATDVRTWCHAHGQNPKLRIVLCGYAGEHSSLEDDGWTAMPWKAAGGYGNTGDGPGRANAFKETIWFSPHCIIPETTL